MIARVLLSLRTHQKECRWFTFNGCDCVGEVHVDSVVVLLSEPVEHNGYAAGTICSFVVLLPNGSTAALPLGNRFERSSWEEFLSFENDQ